jgi:RNA polymerase sigma factor (sigma-70 family)
MSEQIAPKLTTSDEALVERARSGDQRAFAELWRRHYRSGARVARQFTSSLDADDLVSEAYTRIYQRVLAGGGPTGAFRPYLYTTIRNLASSWGSAQRHVQVEKIEDFEDPDSLDDPVAIALDRTLTARAFKTLPERWQSVLWYTEVEGMDPHEVAPILGMTANGVAALSYRAREGLRKAWLQAHINDVTGIGDCSWSISKIGDHARNGLSARDQKRMAVHLAGCARCAIISEEVDEVGSRLAMVLIPLFLGGVAGGAFLTSFGTASTAVAAEALPAIPAIPEAIGAAAVAGTSIVGTAAAPVALVTSLAIAVAVSGSAMLPSTDEPTHSPTFSTSISETVEPTPVVGDVVADVVAGPAVVVEATEPVPTADDPANIPAPNDSVVGSVIDTITGGTPPPGHTAPGGVLGADISFTISGSGTPGAHISVQAAGQVYATTTVDADGHFTLAITAVPGGLSSLDVVQVVDRSYLLDSLGLGGLLGGLLGSIDDLVNALIQPLHLDTLPGGISLNILS